MHSSSSLRSRAAAAVASTTATGSTASPKPAVSVALAIGFILAICSGFAVAGCAPSPSASNGEASATTVPRTEQAADLSAASEATGEAESQESDTADSPRDRERVPLHWNVDETQLVGRQGSTALWGTCGQCCIANTLNLVTSSARTEAEIVGFTVERELCDPSTGGMTLENMVDAYTGLLPLDAMDVLGYGGDYAPTVEEMAELLESGVILNVGVYGEMMREGGHTGEGELHGTHWTVLHGTDRAADGELLGFRVIDSASSITYLTAQELSDIYYGHDGTTIIDPACIEVYGLA